MQPSDLQTQVNAIQWTNGARAITGAMVLGLFATIFSIFSGMGTWDSNGNYTIGSSVLQPYLPGITTSAVATNPETGTRTGPGFQNTNPTVPFIFSTAVTQQAYDNIDGTWVFAKTANYTGTGVTSYIGSGAVNAYTMHAGDTHNDEAGLVGVTMTTDHGNSQPFGTASSVGVVGEDVCEIQGCIAGWGGLFNEVEKSGTADPGIIHYGAEIGYFANGSDAHGARTALLLAGHQTTFSGTVTAITNMLLVATDTNVVPTYGINLSLVPTQTTAAILLSAQRQGTITWQSNTGTLDINGFTAGSRIFTATDNNMYFDNYNATGLNFQGFEWRLAGAAQAASLTAGGFNLQFGVYEINGTPGVSCSGAPSASYSVSKGIVVHC